ncbi:hypothetical protein [uncultured Dokdonia sp.]|uniref:hypothetical protein n=1 Tax=uncultured Dokdonia sp. TaxID=575653 RepID=UPI0026163331|nr:hypothetical protein [uncultured Dokdonia sp.]
MIKVERLHGSAFAKAHIKTTFFLILKDLALQQGSFYNENSAIKDDLFSISLK